MGQQLTATSRYVAFLRAINVGGHTVKMDHLRGLFEQLEFSNVETFIASGNVIFESPDDDTRGLETRIAGHLRQALGYDVETFIRSIAELCEIAVYRPFPAPALDAEGISLNVSFLQAPPRAEAMENLMAFRTESDDFSVHEREIYWLRQGRISDSAFSGALLERAIGMPATMRNMNTVKRLAAKYSTPR